MRHQSGFTLTEVLVSVALIGILAAVTMPGFSGFLNGQKISTAANNIYTAVQLTKASAIQQNARTTLVFDAETSNWCIFNRSLEPDSIDCKSTTNALSNGIVRKFIEPLPNDLSVAVAPASATQITYDGLGRIVNNPDLSSPMTSIAVTMLSDTTRANTVQLINGIVRLCDPKKSVGDSQAC